MFCVESPSRLDVSENKSQLEEGNVGLVQCVLFCRPTSVCGSEGVMTAAGSPEVKFLTGGCLLLQVLTLLQVTKSHNVRMITRG